MYARGPANATRVLVTRNPSHLDEWSRSDRAYYGSGTWGDEKYSTFRLPNLTGSKVDGKVIRWQSSGTTTERVR